MRSTLFYIPHSIAGVPLFGFGLLVAFLMLALLAWVGWQLKQRRPWSEILSALPFWLVTAALIVWVLPNVEARWPDGTPIGLPIRGYGVMVLLGLFSGIGISVLRGRQLGIAPDTIIGLGFWMMVGGVLGARLFYVAQKWEEFDDGGLVQRLVSIAKLTEGGLVIYGGVIGGLIAGAVYCYRHRLHVPSTADLVAPAFLIGYSLGRIGCLLHGCCFGGVCTVDLPTIEFPHGSGPYQAQIVSGELLGMQLEGNALPFKVAVVVPGSPAATKGIQVGDRVMGIYLHAVQPDQESDPTAPDPLVVDIELSGSQREGSRIQRVTLFPDDLPASSLPVHPSQVYAAINGLLLCLLVWFLQPLPQRDGMVFLIAMALYALSRFLLEGVRSDEAGQLGTPLTISQLISLGGASLSIIGIVILKRLPPKRVWDWRGG